MTRNTLLVNTILSVVLGFALSLLFWLIFDVFVLSGFLIWSTASGLAGALIAHLLRRNLPAALLITAVVRIAVFVFFSGQWF